MRQKRPSKLKIFNSQCSKTETQSNINVFSLSQKSGRHFEDELQINFLQNEIVVFGLYNISYGSDNG